MSKYIRAFDSLNLIVNPQNKTCSDIYKECTEKTTLNKYEAKIYNLYSEPSKTK